MSDFPKTMWRARGAWVEEYEVRKETNHFYIGSEHMDGTYGIERRVLKASMYETQAEAHRAVANEFKAQHAKYAARAKGYMQTAKSHLKQAELLEGENDGL
jgi:hypothetical protein